MRVAQIAPLFESVPPKMYGGTERVVDNLTRGLIAAGADVTVFCSGDSTTSGRIHPVWPEALRLSTKKIVDPHAYSIRMLASVAELASEFDIIHNHYDYSLLPLTRMTNVPVVSTMHNRVDFPEDVSVAYSAFLDAPLVSISNSQRRPMPHLNWVSTVLHGIEIEKLDFNPNPGKYLAFLGRFSRDKRADWAIDIAVKSGIPLKIAAKIDPSDQAYYETEVKPRIDGKFIEYVGEISEAQKSDFLGNALALVFPIDWPEPFGLVMIEAMACGTPVLARPFGAVPEVICDGLTGFIRSEIDDLAQLINATRALDRSAIRHYAKQRFSIERMTEEYLNVYQSIINSNRYAHESPHPRRMAGDRWNFLYPVNRSPERNTKGIA